MARITKNFTTEEFRCRCGCGNEDIDQGLVKMLQNARDMAGFAFRITSGVRCDDHNAAIGGKDNSAHLRGLAVDIACENSWTRYDLVAALQVAGFRRIGIRKDFVHADIDETLPMKRLWLY